MTSKICSVLIISMMLVVNSHAATGHKLGDQAPEFTLKTLAGDKYSLTDLRSRGHVLLVFWATECVYCFAHLGDYKQAHKQFGDKGLTVAAINIGGEYDPEVKEYVEDNEIEYLVLSDRLNNLYVSEDYNVVGTPTLVMVSPEGKIVFRGHKVPELDKWLFPNTVKSGS